MVSSSTFDLCNCSNLIILAMVIISLFSFIRSVAKWSELVELWSEIWLFGGKWSEYGPIYHLKVLPRASKQQVTFDWKLSATFRMFWGTVCLQDSWSLDWGFPLRWSEQNRNSMDCSLVWFAKFWVMLASFSLISALSLYKFWPCRAG